MNDTPIKAGAERLRAYLKTIGITLNVGQSLEAAARVHGYKNWHTAAPADKKAAPPRANADMPVIYLIKATDNSAQLALDLLQLLAGSIGAFLLVHEPGCSAELIEVAQKFVESAQSGGVNAHLVERDLIELGPMPDRYRKAISLAMRHDPQRVTFFVGLNATAETRAAAQAEVERLRAQGREVTLLAHLASNEATGVSLDIEASSPTDLQLGAQ